jgi:nitrite reductase/ring-hydroxylating ferredoxin subunit
MALSSEYQLGEYAFPRGWFMVAASDTVTDRATQARFFGQDVVLYRTDAGKPVMLDAYCAHMGAHMADADTQGMAKKRLVEGDSIRCPLHGWRYGADGRCNQIPYSAIPIPASARLKSWPLIERGGFVFTWFDPEGGEPNFELPDFAEWSDPAWVASPIDEFGVLATHPQELVEHGVDKIHLVNVHGSNSVVGHVVTHDGPFAVTHSTTRDGLPGDAGELTTEAYSRYYGPGVLLATMEGFRQAIFFFCHTPVDDGSVRAWHGVILKSLAPVATDEDAALLDVFHHQSLASFAEDLHILVRKRPSLSVMQIPGDGPFRRHRLWYSQFYNARAEAAAIQAKADGVTVTEGVHAGDWISAA